MPNTIISRKEYQEMKNLSSKDRELVEKIRELEDSISKSNIAYGSAYNVIQTGKTYFAIAKEYSDKVNQLLSGDNKELLSQYINEGITRQKIQDEIRENLFVRQVREFISQRYSAEQLAEAMYRHTNDSNGEYVNSITEDSLKGKAGDVVFVWEAMKFYEANREVTAKALSERKELEKAEGIALSEEYDKLQVEFLSMNEFLGNPITEQNAETYLNYYVKMPEIVERIGEISKRGDEIRQYVKNPDIFTTAGTYQDEYWNKKQSYLDAMESYIDGIENGEAVKQFHSVKNTINVEIKDIKEKDKELHNKLENQYTVNLMTEKTALESKYKAALGKISFSTGSEDINAKIVNTLVKEKYNAVYKSIKQDYEKISAYNYSKKRNFDNDYENYIMDIRSAERYAGEYINELSSGKTDVQEFMEKQLNEMNEAIERTRVFGEKTGKPYADVDVDLKKLSSLKEQAAAAIIESKKTPQEKKEERKLKFLENHKDEILNFDGKLDQKREELSNILKEFEDENDEKKLISKWLEINAMHESKEKKPSMSDYIIEFKKIKKLPEDAAEQIKQVENKYKLLEEDYFKFTDKVIDKVYTPKFNSYMKTLDTIKDGVIPDRRINLSKMKADINSMFIRSEIHSEKMSGLRKNLFEKYDDFFKELDKKTIEVENTRRKEAEEQARRERETTKEDFKNSIDDAWKVNGRDERPLFEYFQDVRARLDKVNKDSLISKEDKEYCNNLFREQVVEPYIQKCLDSYDLRDNAECIKMLLNAEKADMAPVDNVWQAMQEGRRKTVLSSGDKGKLVGPKFVFDVSSKEIFDDLEKVKNTDYGMNPDRWEKFKNVRSRFLEGHELHMILGMDANKITEVASKVDRLIAVKAKCDFLYQPEEIMAKGKKQPIKGKPRVEVLKDDFDKKSPSLKKYEKDCKVLEKSIKNFEKERDSFLKKEKFDEKAFKSLESKYEEISKRQNELEGYDLISAKEKKYPKISSPDSSKLDSKCLKDLYKGLDNRIRDFYSIGNVDRKQIVEEVEKGISRLDMLGIKGKDYDDYKDFVDCYYADERRKGLANDFETFAKEDIKKEKMNFKELQEEMEKYDGFKEPKHGVTKKDVSAVKDALIRENAYAK